MPESPVRIVEIKRIEAYSYCIHIKNLSQNVQSVEMLRWDK